MQFYVGLNDNRFCPKENILVLLEQRLFLQISPILQKANFFIHFSLHFSLKNWKEEGGIREKK